MTFLQHDGYEKFEIRLPHQGIVTLKTPLDFETNRYYELNVIAVVSASFIFNQTFFPLGFTFRQTISSF